VLDPPAVEVVEVVVVVGGSACRTTTWALPEVATGLPAGPEVVGVTVFGLVVGAAPEVTGGVESSFFCGPRDALTPGRSPGLLE
jgi:hypothetical protein